MKHCSEDCKEDEDRHWYLAKDIIDSNIITIGYSKDGSYLEDTDPIDNKWFFTREEAEDYIKVIKQKELEEKCNNITEENMNIAEM